jgi:hypothetical protein
VDAGGRHVEGLVALAEGLSATRAGVLGRLGVVSGGVPPALVARWAVSFGVDPLAELIAEATIANGFVREVREALLGF